MELTKKQTEEVFSKFSDKENILNSKLTPPKYIKSDSFSLGQTPKP